MKRNLISELQQRSRSIFLKCRAPCAAARSLAANGRSPRRGPPTARRLRRGAPRRRRRLPPRPTLLYPPPQHGIAQAKFLGHRSDRAATRCDQINRLPLVVVRKRPTLTSFHPTPPGSPSLLQVSISSEEVHCQGARPERPATAARPRQPTLASAGAGVQNCLLNCRKSRSCVSTTQRTGSYAWTSRVQCLL